MRYESLIKANFEVTGQSGDEFVCRCPWHDDKGKPNLYINAVKGLYLCHACGAKGHLERVLDSLPPLDVGDVRDRLKKVMMDEDTKEPVMPDSTLSRFNFPHEEWGRRGLSDETVKKFDLGYDPFNDVLTIPMRNMNGGLIGVITRRLDDLKPKYMYPKGFQKADHLFGGWLIGSYKKVALVEGSIDCMAMWDARLPAVAQLGSNLSANQVSILQRQGVETLNVMLDNDVAGIGYPEHVGEVIRSRRGKCEICGREKTRNGEVHPATGVWQVQQALKGSGIVMRVGWYRPYWQVKDPADLKPQQRRKMFYSTVSFAKWNSVMYPPK